MPGGTEVGARVGEDPGGLGLHDPEVGQVLDQLLLQGLVDRTAGFSVDRGARFVEELVHLGVAVCRGVGERHRSDVRGHVHALDADLRVGPVAVADDVGVEVPGHEDRVGEDGRLQGHELYFGADLGELGAQELGVGRERREV